VEADGVSARLAQTMNRAHAVVCSSSWWARSVERKLLPMLHHLPSPELQDRLLAEASRVLRAGGMFAGTDSLATGSAFKLLHLRDTLVPVPPTLLAARLEAVGFVRPSVEQAARSFRFRAFKPAIGGSGD
jgi:hypothetical protein